MESSKIINALKHRIILLKEKRKAKIMENHSDQESNCSCSLEETHGSFKVVWDKFWNNATVHGFPYVFSSAGEY